MRPNKNREKYSFYIDSNDLKLIRKAIKRLKLKSVSNEVRAAVTQHRNKLEELMTAKKNK